MCGAYVSVKDAVEAPVSFIFRFFVLKFIRNHLSCKNCIRTKSNSKKGRKTLIFLNYYENSSFWRFLIFIHRLIFFSRFYYAPEVKNCFYQVLKYLINAIFIQCRHLLTRLAFRFYSADLTVPPYVYGNCPIHVTKWSICEFRLFIQSFKIIRTQSKIVYTSRTWFYICE